MNLLRRCFVLLALALTAAALSSSASAAPIVYPGGCFYDYNQYPYVWVKAPNGNVINGSTVTVTQGAYIYFTGIVAKRTRASFDLINEATGQVVYTHITQPARKNCVIHHEPEAFSTGNLAPGRYKARATFWSYCYPVVDQYLGTLVVNAYVRPPCDPDPSDLIECRSMGGWWDWIRCYCVVRDPYPYPYPYPYPSY